MPVIRVKDGEPLEVALRRFKRACEKSGLQSELRRREAYEKPTTVRKRKRAAAEKRHQKKVMRDDPFAMLRGAKKRDKRKQHLALNLGGGAAAQNSAPAQS